MSSSDHRRPGGGAEMLLPNERLTPVLERLTDRRRRALACLLEDGPLPERELAARLAADGTARRPEAAAVEAALGRLRQVDLPALADVDLIERTERRVRAGEALQDRRVRKLVEADADLEALVDCLADATRRRVLATLADRDDPVGRDDLAAALAGDGDEEGLRTALHHRHLPKLDAAGLLAYDAGSGRLVPAVSARDAEWVESFARP